MSKDGYFTRTVNSLAAGKPVTTDKFTELSPSKLVNYILYNLGDNIGIEFPDGYESLSPKQLAFKTLITKIVNDAFLSIEKYHRFTNADSKELKSQYPEEFRKVLQSPEFLKYAFSEEITQVLTAHPNGFLGLDTEQKSSRLVSLIIDSAKRSPDLLLKVANWDGKREKLPKIPGKTFNQINKLTVGMWQTFVSPEKMTTDEECLRFAEWLDGIYESTPDYLNRIHSIRRTLAPNKEVVSSTTRFSSVISEPSVPPLTPEDLKAICNGRGVKNVSNFSEREEKIRLGKFMHETILLSHEQLSELRKSDWGIPGGYATIEELLALHPGTPRNWGWDADGKKATQPYRNEKFLHVFAERFKTNYSNSIDQLITEVEEIFRDTEYELVAEQAAEIIATLKESNRVLKEGNVSSYSETLMDTLCELKQKYEEKGFEFPPAVDKEGKQIPYSQLDLLICQVNRFRSFGSFGEIRQNARENKEGLGAIAKILKNTGFMPESLKNTDISENPELLMSYLERNQKDLTILRESFAELYEKFVPIAELGEPGMTEPSEIIKQHPQLERVLKDLSAVELSTAMQVLGFFYVSKKYPNSVSSFVIAEAATVEKEIKETGNEEKIRAAVVKNGLRDSRQVMLYRMLADASPKIKITTLAEDPATTRNKEFLFEAKLNDPYHIKEYAGYTEPMRYFDMKKNQWRDMTLADFKKTKGLKAEKGDNKITIFTGPEEMDAGSDSAGRGSKAMALIISNARNEVDLKAINNPIELQYGSKTVKAVVIPARHAGIGEGGARMKGIGDHPHERINVYTCQGGGNAMKRDWVHDIMTHQLAHLTILYAHPEVKEPEYQERFPIDLRLKPASHPVSEFRMTEAEKRKGLDRARECSLERNKMVLSPAHDNHLTFGTNGRHAALMNRSARKQSRNKAANINAYPTEAAFELLRMIGFVDMINNSGDRGTETQLKKFFIRNEDDIQNNMLTKEARVELLNLFIKDIITNRVIWDAADAYYVASYENAWKMEGCEARTENGKTIISFKNLEATTEQLAEHYHAGTVPEGFRASHTAMAVLHDNAMATGKVVLELCYRIKHGTFPHGELDADHERILKDRLSEVDNDFRKLPDMMKHALSPESQEELLNVRSSTNAARKFILQDHLARLNEKEGLSDEDLFYVGTVHYLNEEFGGRRYHHQHYPNLHLPDLTKEVAR